MSNPNRHPNPYPCPRTVIILVLTLHRTFKNLLYSNVATHEHFKMLIDRYHRVTHRCGKVCVRDRHVLRRVTDDLREDEKVFNMFSVLAHPVSFHSDDLRRVFLKYLYRVETLIGNEVAAQLMEDLRIREVETLGSLRKLKQKRKVEIVGGVPDMGEGKGKGEGKKKRKRRKKKKKGW